MGTPEHNPAGALWVYVHSDEVVVDCSVCNERHQFKTKDPARMLQSKRLKEQVKHHIQQCKPKGGPLDA